MKIALFNDTRPTRHYGCELVMQNLQHLLEMQSMEPVWFWPVGHDWRNQLDQLPSRGDVDAVIVNGEGSMHHSIDRPRVEALADIAKMSKERLGVPAFLINATIYENELSIYRKLADYCKIYVRDSLSHKELCRYNLNSHYVADLTLSYPRKISVQRESAIGGIDSVLGDISKQIRAVCLENGWAFEKMKRKDDKKFLRRIRSLFYKEKQVEDFLRFIASKKLILTGRYHAVAMCLLTRTPFVALESNTPKISSLLLDVFGNTSRLLQADCSIVPDSLENFSPFSSQELEAIDNFLEIAQQSSQEMMTSIAEQINRE